MRATVLTIVAVSLAIAHSQRLSPTPVVPGAISISPNQVKWTTIPDGNGRETADLFGDRSKHELFGYMIRWPPNTIFKAHTHPDTRYTMVLSGTFYHGYGTTFDANKLERRSTGTLFTEPANTPHFGATKAEGAILYFVGVGPDRTDRVEK